MLFYKQRLFNVLTDGADSGGAAGGTGDAGSVSDRGGDASAAGNAGANATGAPGSGLDWGKIKSALPADLANDTSLSTINSLEGLVKGYVHSQKAMGNRVPIPDKHATPDDWKQFFHKVGNPAKLEEYKVNLPKEAQIDESFLKEITAAAHASGVLPWQMEKILGKYTEVAGGMSQQQETALKARMEEDLNGLKKEWGDAFEDKSKAANVAFKELLPDEALRQRLVEDGLASHPAVVRILANASKLFKEDTFIGHGEGKLGGVSPEEALEKAREIQGNKDHPYRNPGHPNHIAAKKEVMDLYDIAFKGQGEQRA